MPAHRLRPTVDLLVDDKQDLGVLRIAVARNRRVIVERAEAPAEGDVAGVIEPLPPEEQDDMRPPGLLDRGEGVAIDLRRQIHAQNFRAQTGGEPADFKCHVGSSPGRLHGRPSGSPMMEARSSLRSACGG